MAGIKRRVKAGAREHHMRFYTALTSSGLKPENFSSVGDLAADLNCTRHKVYWMISAGWIKAERIAQSERTKDDEKLYAIPEQEVLNIVSHEHPQIENILEYIGNHTGGRRDFRWIEQEGETAEKRKAKSSS